MIKAPSFDLELFKLVLSMREGLPYPLLRREITKYVKTLSEEQKQEVLGRRDEILEDWIGWKESNYWVLTRIGFTEEMTVLLQDKRLESPGMRRVIIHRAIELGYVKESVLGE